MNCALKKTSEVLCNFIWLSAPPCLSLSPSLSLPLPISLSLSLSLYNFPDEHNDGQRELTFDHDKTRQGVCIHIQVQYLCEDQLEPRLFRVAFGQHSLLQEATSGLGPEFEI